MSNVTIVNAASEEGRRLKALKEKDQKKRSRKKALHGAIGASVLAANLFIKLAQLLFMTYIIMFDTDLMEFLTGLTGKVKDLTAIEYDIPYLERTIIYGSVFFVAIVSARGCIKLNKMLFTLIRAHKNGSKIRIATDFKYFIKDAILEGFAAVVTMGLFSILNSYNGMNINEYALSAIFTACFAFYCIAHTVRGIEILKKRRDIDNKRGKFRRYW